MTHKKRKSFSPLSFGISSSPVHSLPYRTPPSIIIFSVGASRDRFGIYSDQDRSRRQNQKPRSESRVRQILIENKIGSETKSGKGTGIMIESAVSQHTSHFKANAPGQHFFVTSDRPLTRYGHIDPRTDVEAASGVNRRPAGHSAPCSGLMYTFFLPHKENPSLQRFAVFA
ncbi:hypothetical protein EVAR_47781_1 [Eumeta japonica]|uniref:Uncharacterized protein n=1 Tax=Eumeta variegata TaxID=151549 RepID=A0A4C1XVS9_EUMVA|nr:hypothetical protein EVAR_47781_1 [Eumeta japonica]